MVVGNPDDFSIMFDVVDEWNSDTTFNNGLLFMSIDGKIFLSELTTATLNVELPQLIKNLKNPAENKEIFHMEKKEAFTYIYGLTFPSDWDMDNDYSYDITPNEFGDRDCFVFMVSNGDIIRILAASELQYIEEESTHNLQDINVAETYISKEELERMVEKLGVLEQQMRENKWDERVPESP